VLSLKIYWYDEKLIEVEDTDVVGLWGLACVCGTMGAKEIINKRVPSLAFTSNNGAMFLPSMNVK